MKTWNSFSYRGYATVTPKFRNRLRNLARQIAPGRSYTEIAKVVTIVITNYDIIKADDIYHHVFSFYDGRNGVLFTDVAEIRTLELKKLPETNGENDKERELINWLRLIRSESEEEIDMIETKTPEMKAAVSRLVHLSEDERTRMLYEARELAMMDEMARIEGAKKEGIAKGERLGIVKGEKRGITKGLKRGERSKAIDMAKKMLKKGIDVYEVAEISGLSLEEVESLRE